MDFSAVAPWPMDDEPRAPRRKTPANRRPPADEQMRNARILTIPHALERALDISPMRAAQLRIRSSYALVYAMVAVKRFNLLFVTLHEDGRQEIRTNERYTWKELSMTLAGARTPLPVENAIWRPVHKHALDPFTCPEMG